VTFYMLGLAGVLVALRRRSPRDRIGLLSSEAGRQCPGASKVIGYFANGCLPLWADVPAEAGVLDILDTVRARTFELLTFGAPEEFWVDRYVALATNRQQAIRRASQRFSVPHLYFSFDSDSGRPLQLHGLRARAYDARRVATMRGEQTATGVPAIYVTLESLNGRWRLTADFVATGHAKRDVRSLLQPTVRALETAVAAVTGASAGRA
jgi:hypothetical protein